MGEQKAPEPIRYTEGGRWAKSHSSAEYNHQSLVVLFSISSKERGTHNPFHPMDINN